MINTLLYDSEDKKLEFFQNTIRQCCPEVQIFGKVEDYAEAKRFLDGNGLSLMIINVCVPDINLLALLNKLATDNIEFIIVTDLLEFAYEAIKFCANGFVLKPIESGALVAAIKKACKCISEKKVYEENRKVIAKLHKKLSKDDFIGIPTIEGYDFIHVDEIIRCRGMQRCTQIVTEKKPSIVSSYNLGEFKKLLEPFDFFSPHRSHIINLNYIKKYRREGLIIMEDNASIPVSKTRRNDFLRIINRI